MENPAKILKVDEELDRNPFIKLHEDIHPFILQHLTGKEVLNVFTISSKSYQTISESPAALKKIQFCFREFSSEEPSRSDVIALLESDRKYQYMRAEFPFIADAGRKLLLLKRFSQSLVDLKICVVKDALASKLPPSLSFLKLKSLDIKASAQISVKLLQAASGIEKLFIGTDNMDEEVVSCLMKMKSLKELTLRGNRAILFAKHSMKDAKFKLKALTVEDTESENKTPFDAFIMEYLDIESSTLKQTRTNFQIFVQQSAETMETLNFDVCSNEDVDLALGKLPALKHLNINEYPEDWGSESKLQLKPNESIKSFKCHGFDSLPKQTKFLECLTNLEVLSAMVMTQKHFEWIVRNKPTLKKLHFSYWQPNKGSPKNVKECYNKLKKTESSVNRNIEIHF
jgi:hypothetical protein